MWLWRRDGQPGQSAKPLKWRPEVRRFDSPVLPRQHPVLNPNHQSQKSKVRPQAQEIFLECKRRREKNWLVWLKDWEYDDKIEITVIWKSQPTTPKVQSPTPSTGFFSFYCIRRRKKNWYDWNNENMMTKLRDMCYYEILTKTRKIRWEEEIIEVLQK